MPKYDLCQRVGVQNDPGVKLSCSETLKDMEVGSIFIFPAVPGGGHLCFLSPHSVCGGLGHVPAKAAGPRQLFAQLTFPNGYSGAFQNSRELSVVIVTGPLLSSWPRDTSPSS